MLDFDADGNLVTALTSDITSKVADLTTLEIEALPKRPKSSTLRQDWAGGLSEFRDQYTSIELQKKALEWRQD